MKVSFRDETDRNVQPGLFQYTNDTVLSKYQGNLLDTPRHEEVSTTYLCKGKECDKEWGVET